MTPVAATEPIPELPVMKPPSFLKFARKLITPGAFSGSVTKKKQEIIPVTTGTAMRATKGDAFLVMIKTSISTTVRKPRNANMNKPPLFLLEPVFTAEYASSTRRLRL